MDPESEDVKLMLAGGEELYNDGVNMTREANPTRGFRKMSRRGSASAGETVAV